MSEDIRRAIATEAARLLLRRKESNHAAARKRAARWLSRRRVHRDDMPSRKEIDDQFDLLAGLDSAEHQQARLREWQLLAVELGTALAEFTPDFHGPVVDGPYVPGAEIRVTVEADAFDSVVASLRSVALVDRLDLSEPSVVRCRFRRSPVLVGVNDEPDDAIDLATLRALTAPADLPDESFESVTSDEPEIDYDHLEHLLARLEDVRLPSDRHPEGDALYHALQVFELGRAERPWDEEFLVACLVHDAGLAVDPRLGTDATLEALEGLVTPRVLSLVAGLPRIERALQAGRIPKSLRQSGEADDLLLLARCDRDGRVPGRETCTLDEAIAYLVDLGAACDWKEDADAGRQADFA